MKKNLLLFAAICAATTLAYLAHAADSPASAKPNVDRLAAESVRLENFYVSPSCSPTLCAVAGVKIPEKLQPKLKGFSLLPVLEAKEPIEWHDDRLLFQHGGDAELVLAKHAPQANDKEKEAKEAAE